jgi:hypothetical protein
VNISIFLEDLESIDIQVKWLMAMRESIRSRICLMSREPITRGLGVREYVVADGVEGAPTPWVISMPSWSLIPEETLEWCMTSNLNPRLTYKFNECVAPEMSERPSSRRTLLSHVSRDGRRRFQEAPFPVIVLR